ncbi:hypothetical protein BEI46_14135 [Aliivibrio fischeri]|uniref:hypothetical protein n=1 Tax=Aliivibrio fischeri TaxID=668 RepID=UPI00084C0C3C|nr:hypothetical protein [Aliivibrio fischeri]OED54670.1 hypothetical protein BEI46_14135 [Aliivibrio fischeri]
MKDSYRFFDEFILEQKSFFEDALLPEVNQNATPNNFITWDTNNWVYGSNKSGFLAKAKKSFSFKEIRGNHIKNLFKDGEPKEKLIKIEQAYRNFLKAYAISLNKNSNPSPMVVHEQILMFKRIYIRMKMAGVDCHPVNINSEFLQDATDMVAASRTGPSAKSNASKDYDVAKVIARNLNYFDFTLTSIDVQRKTKVNIGTNYTEEAKDKEARDNGESSKKEKNLSIQTFLNIVTLRSMIQTDGEKVILNLVLLLMVTGFRHMEAALIGLKDFKVVEIENKKTKVLMEKRGLPTFYVGIKYQGEKGAGLRTHWIEPLAVELVESLWTDTILLTEKLRCQIEHLREINFKFLLPKSWFDNKITDNIVEFNPQKTVNLGVIVEDIYQSYAQSVFERGASAAKSYAKKKLQNSTLKITPYSVDNLGRTNSKEQHYLVSDIERFLRDELEQDRNASVDLIHRITDSSTGNTYEKPYEDLLFIIPKGSGAPSRSGALKVIPEILHTTILSKFLGYGTKGNEKRSIFAKYNLTEEDGEFTSMLSHVPRHGINTFFSLAGVSEHLQAMFMGRKDFSQNKKYQHLSLEDRIISSELVTVSNTDSFFKEHTALESIKQQATIDLNLNLSLQNSIAQSTHSYTTQEDKTSFVVDVIQNSKSKIFAEWDDVFDLLDDDKTEAIKSHSDLAIMDIGSCMRKLRTFQCPFNMKCQDGSQCPYFTLTGRMDETAKIERLLERIQFEIVLIKQMEMDCEITSEECNDILEELNLRIENISFHLNQSQVLDSEKVQINLAALDSNQKPKMLSSLFSLEQRCLEKIKGSQC